MASGIGRLKAKGTIMENNDNKDNKEPMSRRDFLRRAGKEAADTGAKIIPGGAIARKFVEAGDTNRGDFVAPSRRRWWDKLVSRKTEE